MTNDGQHADQAKFKVEDELDLLFGRANPNPAREGCPSRDVLEALARRARPMEDPGYEHLAKCSPCFKEFRAVQQADVARTAAVRLRRRIAYAAAAVLAVAAVGSFFVVQRSRGPAAGASTTGVEQSAKLDLRPFAVTRNDQPTVEPGSLVLPRGRLNVIILLPVGYEPGEYEMQVLDAEFQVRASAKGTAAIRDFVTTLEASLDLSALSPGRYRLAVRRQGAEWRLFPTTLR